MLYNITWYTASCHNMTQTSDAPPSAPADGCSRHCRRRLIANTTRFCSERKLIKRQSLNMFVLPFKHM